MFGSFPADSARATPCGRLAETAGVQIIRPHPHILCHTFVMTMLDAGVDLRDVQIAACHADPQHHDAV
jgi:site-specific recombinase XerD